MLPSAGCPVPDMDLWVPARQGTSEPGGQGAGGWPEHPTASSGSPEDTSVAHSGNGEACPVTSAAVEEAGWAQGPSRAQSTGQMGSGHLRVADTRLPSSEGPAHEVGSRPPVPQAGGRQSVLPPAGHRGRPSGVVGQPDLMQLGFMVGEQTPCPHLLESFLLAFKRVMLGLLPSAVRPASSVSLSLLAVKATSMGELLRGPWAGSHF